jgi:flagellar basal body-associated protein FliL
MTQSQLLNEKREVIAPIYKRKSFIILITVIALLMAGLAAYSFRA